MPENFERTRRLTPCGTLDRAFWLDNNRLAMARFIATLRSAAPAVLFGLRLWASVCLALYIAFWLQLDNAYWAGASAVTVCQPILGASLRKAWFRVVGTAVGAVAIVFLTACFPQDRVGFLLGLALWGAVCGLVATLLRNFASYGAALAAVTAAVIASDELGAVGGANGDAVLLLAVTRASEICIGIICAGVVLAASDFGGARRRLATQLATISAEITGQLVGTFLLVGPEQSRTRPVRRDLIRHVTALDPVIDEALGESSDLRPHSPELQAAVGGLFAALSGWRTAAVHLELQRSDLGQREAASVLGSIPPELRSMSALGEAAVWTVDPSKWCKACASAVRTLTSLPANTPSLRLLADRTAEALIGIRLALTGLLLLVNSAQKIPRSRPAWFSVPDRLPALVNAARIFATIGAVELFWIATAWPGGATTIVFAAIAVIVFSPRADLAYSTAIGFMIGASLATVLAGIVKFAVLPDLTTFAGFCLAIGIVLVPAGMLLARCQSPMLMAMVVVFLPLLQPANQMSYDTLQFYNSALAIIVGVGAGALSFRLLPPLSPTLRIRRLLALTLRDLRRLTRGPIPRSVHGWEGRIYGRLSAMPEQAEPLQRAHLLAALTVGTETIRLRRIARRLDQEVELDAALDAVARGDSFAAIEHLDRLERTLVAVPGTRPGGRVRLRARGSVLVISEALAQHTSYFGSGVA